MPAAWRVGHKGPPGGSNAFWIAVILAERVSLSGREAARQRGAPLEGRHAGPCRRVRSRRRSAHITSSTIEATRTCVKRASRASVQKGPAAFTTQVVVRSASAVDSAAAVEYQRSQQPELEFLGRQTHPAKANVQGSYSGLQANSSAPSIRCIPWGLLPRPSLLP